MNAPILGADSLNLNTELGQFWPWTDTVDAATDASVCINCCGPLVYQVTDQLFNPVNIVRLDGNTLYFEPTLAHAPGGRFIELNLVAGLSRYPQVAIGYDPFRVQLRECEPVIDPSAVMTLIQDQVVSWGMPPVTYNAYSALTQYVQDPPCDYTFNFAAKISVTDPVTGIAELVDLPSWLIFDPNYLTFNM